MRRVLLMIAALSALAFPASAGAVTFGSNLSAHASNSNVVCGDFNAWWTQYAGRVGCSAFTTGNAYNPGDTSANHIVPFPDPAAFGDQHGTITQVRFKPAPGAPAGPARLSVVEFVRQGGEPALAQDIADGATFTMTPGSDGLVHVLTNLPARSLYNQNDHTFRYDALVVSMLDNTTPIPADLTSQFASAWISPYVDLPGTNGDLTVPLPSSRQGTGCCGFGPDPFYASGAWYSIGEVLMQADLTIDQNQNGPGATPVTFGRGRLARKVATVPVTCALDTTCAGLLKLLGGTKAAAAKKKKSRQPKLYGKARFSIPAHTTRRVKAKLTKAGRKLRRRKSVRVVARATVGSQVTSSVVKLTRK
ncbi:MAG: hypothetical protein WB771_00940 [Solirubrobacterales bacterium]